VLGTLETRELRVHFEGVKALDGVDLALRPGEILGLIGPNGAGKTTLVNVITGFQPPTTGAIVLDGRELTKLPAHRRARLGLARTFQSVRLFEGLTVLQNVEVSALGAGLSRREARARAHELLDLLGLAERAHEQAGSLPQGDERRLGIARALAARPTFLLLDEPAAGLDEAESDTLMRTIARIRDEAGCGVLVIEHDMRLIMRLCERIQVLDYGKTISVGTPDEVRADPKVITAYLGEPTRRNRARR
jgi:branched-chain amino acid transport system ATP-binding protein